MFLTLLNDLNVTSVGSFDLDCPPSQDTSQRKNDTTHIYILYNVYMNMSIYIKEIYSIDIMFIPHIILNQKKQPSLLPQKKTKGFDLHICFNPKKKNTTGAIFASDKGTWFH